MTYASGLGAGKRVFILGFENIVQPQVDSGFLLFSGFYEDSTWYQSYFKIAL
jgi:hypothetical protein